MEAGIGKDRRVPAAVSGQLRHRHRQYPVKGQNENVVEEVNYGKMISEAIAC